MKTEESLLHLNMLIFRVLLFGLAGALIVALAISKPPPVLCSRNNCSCFPDSSVPD